MRIELEACDIESITVAVTAEVVKALRPLLAKGGGESDRLMSVTELAEYLKVKPGWIYKRTQLKEIPYTKLGRFVMFRQSEIDAWVDREGRMPQVSGLSSSLKVV